MSKLPEFSKPLKMNEGMNDHSINKEKETYFMCFPFTVVILSQIKTSLFDLASFGEYEKRAWLCFLLQQPWIRTAKSCWYLMRTDLLLQLKILSLGWLKIVEQDNISRISRLFFFTAVHSFIYLFIFLIRSYRGYSVDVTSTMWVFF